MTRSRTGALLGVALLVLALMVSSLAAQPEHGAVAHVEEEHGEEEHGSETFLGLPTWIWMTANLLLFFGLLGYYVGPALRDFLDARAKEIRASLALAQEQRREAEEMKSSLKSQIAGLEAEMDEVLARAREEGERERQEILAQAEHERSRLLEQADEEIRFRLAQAQKELSRHTAGLAEQLARQKLEESMGADDRRRLFDESLGRLEREVQ